MKQLGYALCLHFTFNEVLSTLHLLNSTKHCYNAADVRTGFGKAATEVGH